MTARMGRRASLRVAGRARWHRGARFAGRLPPRPNGSGLR